MEREPRSGVVELCWSPRPYAGACLLPSAARLGEPDRFWKWQLGLQRVQTFVSVAQCLILKEVSETRRDPSRKH